MKCLLKWIAALAVVAGLLALAAALLCRTRETNKPEDPRCGRTAAAGIF